MFKTIHITLILFFGLFFQNGIAQELNCQVEVVAPSLQGNSANDDIMQSLKQSVFEMVNNTKWTNDTYSVEERIECSILITISTRTSDNFTGTIQVQSFRPVLNSSYRTQVFNFLDKNVEFKYLRNTAIIFKPTEHYDNLADLLAFYAYMILGYDYDTFSLEGGTEHFTKAQMIVGNAQNAQESGWKSNEDTRNRYWLIDNALHSVFAPLRKFHYEYYRQGMDLFYSNKDAALKNALASLKYFEEVHKVRPGSFSMQVLMLAKSSEFVTVFKEGFPDQKPKAFAILKKVDPTNSNKYSQIIR